jgi:hypothetical protein
MKDVSVERLGRVNLITGLNGAGKTSLLEALFLHIGRHNPELPANLNGLRGVFRLDFEPEALWGMLFRNGTTGMPIRLTATDELGETYPVSISLEETGLVAASDLSSSGVRADTGEHSGTSSEDAMRLVIRTMNEDDLPREVSAEIVRTAEGDSRIAKKGNGGKEHDRGVFIPAQGQMNNEKYFSEVDEKSGGVAEVIDLARAVEPDIDRLSLGIVGGEPALRVGMKGLNLMPLAYVGSGMQRWISILLRLKAVSSTYVLIDEIENGLHHSSLPSVWKGIAHLVKAGGVQVFATTHSRECIEAAYRAFGSELLPEEDLFMLHRLDTVRGDMRAASLDVEALGAYLETQGNVRGAEI